jgi:hypothetical protein
MELDFNISVCQRSGSEHGKSGPDYVMRSYHCGSRVCYGWCFQNRMVTVTTSNIGITRRRFFVYSGIERYDGNSSNALWDLVLLGHVFTISFIYSSKHNGYKT